MSNMPPDIEALVQKLREAEKLLRAHHESRWADWLANDADRINRLDFYGIEHLLSAFGGMGSLNDLVFQYQDGAVLHVPLPENEQFSALRQEVYSLASKLKSEEF
ncbi:hypothetical protein HWE04_05380 [Herbaspirillum sp. C7C2]|uniref:DUF6966 domain-containing protein n=1 Tax=Herbaspirillum sp. C7C2 TaxID=2736666 RepID=UPI001F517362|nr:hypothetical protein [Herbaspirillum sp. C7C2]MCI1013274.1 hypothetical protein [Herbaspirillum sp. C7C2]